MASKRLLKFPFFTGATGSSLGARLWGYLPWFGAGLVLMGLGAAIATGGWGPVVVTLLVLGLVLVTLRVLREVVSRDFWDQRSTQTNANLAIAAVAMLLLLGLVNFLVARYPLRLDLTENQLNTLAPQSQQVVRNLKDPVKLWVFSGQKIPPVEALLDNYRRQNPERFSYEFVDRQAQPNLERRLESKADGDVILESGARKQLVQNLSQEPLSESKLTNAIARLETSRTDQVYFLQGHGEHGPDKLSTLIAALEERGYRSQPLNLGEQAVPVEPAPTPSPTASPTPPPSDPDTAEPTPDASTPEDQALPDPAPSAQTQLPADAAVVIVAGPQRSLFDAEVEALQRYLEGGGSVLLLLDPDTKPGLDPLLQEWGLKLDDRLVIDGRGGLGADATGGVVGMGPTAPLITRYGSHPITQDFGQGNSFYPGARAIQIENQSGIQATPLLLTNDQSWAERDVLDRVSFDPSRDLKGPLTLGVALSRPSNPPPAQVGQPPTPTNAKEPRLVVIGNSSFITDGLVNQQLNQDVVLNSISWLSKRDGEVLSISPRQPKDRRIVLDALRARLVLLLALFVLPVLALGMATLLWWKRR